MKTNIKNNIKDVSTLVAIMALLIFSVSWANGAFANSIIDENAVGDQGTGGDDAELIRARYSLHEIQTAWKRSDKRANVLVVQNHRNVTHKLRLREMMNTLIVLPEGEQIEGVSLGDKTNFVFEPVENASGVIFNNMGNVRAVYPGADTNLILISKAGNIYSFYLRVDTVRSNRMPDLVVYVEDSKISRNHKIKKSVAILDAKKIIEENSEADKKKAEERKNGNYLKTREDTNAAKLNFSYEQAAGDSSLMPIRVMDDGIWTYFQYDEDNLDQVQNLPAIYRVVDGFDTPVNSRIEGGTVVVESISDNWTLRSGDNHACIKKGS